MTYNYLLYSLGSFVVRFSLLMISFQSVFQNSFYILLTLLFARYSPFCCSLSRSSRLILPVLAKFACVWARKQISSPFAINIYIYISNNPYPQKNEVNWAANVFHWNVSLRNFFSFQDLFFQSIIYLISIKTTEIFSGICRFFREQDRWRDAALRNGLNSISLTLIVSRVRFLVYLRIL